MTCIAPTKTFNIAGIQAAMMVIPENQKRRKLRQNTVKHAQMGLYVFAATALEAVYQGRRRVVRRTAKYFSENMD